MTRKGKPIVKRRTKPLEPTEMSLNLTLTVALDYVYTYKQSEGLRERTLRDHKDIFGYFMEWLAEFHPYVTHINDVTSGLIRDYIIYLSKDKYNVEKGTYGLSPYTVNVRVRLLKSAFSVLHKENIIVKNPLEGVKLLKVDKDTFEPLTEDEIRNVRL